MNTSSSKTLGILLVMVAIALGVAGMQLSKRPAQFHAVATVKVERDKIDLPQLGSEVPAGVDTTIFLQTEIELMQSDAPLNKVIEQFDLNQAWGKKYYDGQKLKTSETVNLLKARLRILPVSEETRINITVTSDEAGEAANIANAVAQAYCDYRSEYRRRLAQNALAELSEKFKENEEKLKAARKRVELARQELDPDLRDKTTATDQPESVSEKLQPLRRRYSESVLRYIAQSNQFVIYSASPSHDEDIAGQLEQRAEKTKAEMVTTEATIKDELRKLDALRTFQAAQQELDELTRIFAPLKKTVEELQHDLGPQERAPAEIVEPATAPTKSDTEAGTQGRTFLAGAGLALALGIGLFFLARKPQVQA